MVSYSKELKESLVTRMLVENASVAELSRETGILKYRPNFQPNGFSSLTEERRWVQYFVKWYNT